MNVPLSPLRCIRYAEEQFPHNTAIVCGDLRFTYQQFADRAARPRLGADMPDTGPG